MMISTLEFFSFFDRSLMAKIKEKLLNFPEEHNPSAKMANSLHGLAGDLIPVFACMI